jgi:hypothetical protein
MSIASVLLPLFVQVALTFAVLITLSSRRTSAKAGGEVRGPISLREPNWPISSRQAEYNYQNQFELPVLFYVLTVLAIITRQTDLLFVVLAWVFVITRIVHAAVHLTTNDVIVRGPLFIAGAVVLAIMWMAFIVRILLFA